MRYLGTPLYLAKPGEKRIAESEYILPFTVVTSI